MNIKGNFRKLGELNISDLKKRISEFTDEDWEKNSQRQKKFIVHKYTTSIPLIFDEDGRMHNNTHLPEYYALESLLSPLYNLIDSYYRKSLKYKRLVKKHGKAYPVRTIIARLQAGGEIDAHRDGGHMLSHCHRIHIPIVTEKEINFGVGDENKNLKDGEVWEINNRREHHVENKSEINRIHIIIDWAIPGERCCCSAKTNSQGTCSPDNCSETDWDEAPCDCFH